MKNPDEWDYTKYMKELEKVKTRGISEFYFSDAKNQDIHDFDGFSENLAFEYGAKVLEKIDGNKYKVEIKNKLRLGDYLELLIPGETDTFGFNIEKLYDVKTGEEIEQINPGIKGQAVILKIPCEADVNWILRRKK